MLLIIEGTETMQMKSLSEQVYDYIVRQIRMGELVSGEKVSEGALAESLHVSRTPVREALLALVDDEILINNKNKGFYIQEIHSDSARMKLDIMMQLDAYAAELAIDNISDSDISEMEDIIHRLDLAIEQHDYGFYYDLQESFHDVYLDLSGNYHLIDLVKHFKNSIIRTTFMSEDKDLLFKKLSLINIEHRDILECFRSKDKAKLRQLILAHWQGAEFLEKDLF